MKTNSSFSDCIWVKVKAYFKIERCLDFELDLIREADKTTKQLNRWGGDVCQPHQCNN